MYARYYFIILFFVSSLITKAQLFSGEISIQDNSNYYLNQVYVTNINDFRTVRADIFGKFSIPAKKGDVMRFTSIVTDRSDIKITQDNLDSKINYIQLKVAYYDIEEVVINKFRPTGNLRKDVLSLKNGEQSYALQKAIGLPQPKGDGLPTQLPVASFADGGLSFGLNSIYDLISGEKKKKERLQKYEKMNSAVQQIRQYFGNEYFAAFKIPENLIENFLQFVYTSDNINLFVDNGNFSMIAVYLEKYLPIYQKRLKNSYLLETVK